MKSIQRTLLSAVMALSAIAVAFTQAPAQGTPPAGGRGAAPRLVLSVTSPG